MLRYTPNPEHPGHMTRRLATERGGRMGPTAFAAGTQHHTDETMACQDCGATATYGMRPVEGSKAGSKGLFVHLWGRALETPCNAASVPQRTPQQGETAVAR